MSNVQDNDTDVKQESKINSDDWDKYNNFSYGMIFMCTGHTFWECMGRKLMGARMNKSAKYEKQEGMTTNFEMISTLPPKSVLFLYNHHTKQLHGMYESVGKGRTNIVPEAWKGYGRFPLQVKFRTVYDFEPIHEDKFGKRVFKNDYNRFRRITKNEIKQLIDIFLENSSYNKLSKLIELKHNIDD
eukprot:128661_1